MITCKLLHCIQLINTSVSLGVITRMTAWKLLQALCNMKMLKSGCICVHCACVFICHYCTFFCLLNSIKTDFFLFKIWIVFSKTLTKKTPLGCFSYVQYHMKPTYKKKPTLYLYISKKCRVKRSLLFVGLFCW